jgi:hypothetical protein
MLKTNGPPFRMGQARRRSLPSPSLLRRSSFGYEGRERLRAGRSPFCRAHVLGVRSARQHKGVSLRDKLSNFALRDAASDTAALLDDFFDHSRQLLILNSSRAYTGFLREIFNRPQSPLAHLCKKLGNHASLALLKTIQSVSNELWPLA